MNLVTTLNNDHIFILYSFMEKETGHENVKSINSLVLTEKILQNNTLRSS